jgi:hypothetical protein
MASETQLVTRRDALRGGLLGMRATAAEAPVLN